MKKILSIILSITMLFSFAACSGAEEKLTWQEQYDLGLRYLTELEYDNAILAFNEAIKIDPKQAPAYVALAGAYYDQGDTVKALETINTAISTVGSNDTLEQIKGQIENNTFSPSDTIDRAVLDNSIVETKKQENADGSWVILSFDKEGNEIKYEKYDPDGTLRFYIISEYDENGVPVKGTIHNADGSIQSVQTFDKLARTIKNVYYGGSYIDITEYMYTNGSPDVTIRRSTGYTGHEISTVINHTMLNSENTVAVSGITLFGEKLEIEQIYEITRDGSRIVFEYENGVLVNSYTE